MDPLNITLEEAVELIQRKRKDDLSRHLKTFEEDTEMEVMNGRYGPYIAYKGENYRLPKAMQSQIASLTYQQCLDFVQQQADKPKTGKVKRSYARRK